MLLWAISPGVLLPIPEHHRVLLPQGAEEGRLLPTGQQVHKRCKGWIFHLPDHRDGQGTLRGKEKWKTRHTRWNRRTIINRRFSKAKHEVLPLDQGNPKHKHRVGVPGTGLYFRFLPTHTIFWFYDYLLKLGLLFSYTFCWFISSGLQILEADPMSYPGEISSLTAINVKGPSSHHRWRGPQFCHHFIHRTLI